MYSVSYYLIIYILEIEYLIIGEGLLFLYHIKRLVGLGVDSWLLVYREATCNIEKDCKYSWLSKLTNPANNNLS